MAKFLGSVTRLPGSGMFVAASDARKIEDDQIVFSPAKREGETLEVAVKQARNGMGRKDTQPVYAHPVAENIWLLSDEAPATPVEKAAEKSPRAK